MENEASRVLMRLLEAYICNGLNSEAVFAKLRELDDPPQLCGKMFKSGEPSYFCRLVSFLLFIADYKRRS